MLTASEAALARAVLIHGPVSRSALTSRLNLSPASLTRLAKPFLDRGLFVERDEDADGRVGRPARPLDVAPGLGTFVGVKLTGDALYAVATDVRATPLAASEHELVGHDPGLVAAQIHEAIQGFALDDLRGVGVSVGGSVRDDLVEFAPFLGWAGVDLAGPLSESLGVPVTLDNDLLALAEAEHWFGAGRGLPGFSVITIGAGVGHALVIHHDVVRSREAGVGLAGHLPLAHGGPRCAEGHRGCSQALLTSGSIAAQVAAGLGRPVDYDGVLALAVDDDPVARAVVDAAADALGRFIALAANLTQQPAIVLAGDGMQLFAIAEERVRAAIAGDRDPRADPVELFVDDSGFTGWARGAAAVAIQAALRRIDLSAS